MGTQEISLGLQPVKAIGRWMDRWDYVRSKAPQNLLEQTIWFRIQLFYSFELVVVKFVMRQILSMRRNTYQNRW